MSGVLRTVGKVAGVVALVASVVPGGQPIAAIAALTAAAANTGAALTARRPPVRGGASDITIGADQPTPCMIGDCYGGGALVHRVGYGPTINNVPNPYLAMAVVYSAGGPIAGFDTWYADFQPVGFAGAEATGYFDDILFRHVDLGGPQAAALAGPWGAPPGWGADARLSGKAHALWSLKWDSKNGKYTSGAPQLGVRGRGVLAWDPRADSTYPGGAGGQRWANPTNRAAFDAAKATWAYSAGPGLQGLRYALGTWERDTTDAGSDYQLTFGMGIPIDGIVVEDFVELQNVCDLNGWSVNGVIHEPGDKPANLKRILEAGGASICWKGGRLGLKLSAPRVALDTIGFDDLADGDIEVPGMQTWRERTNAVVPKFTSPDHKWSQQQAKKVRVAALIVADGEEKPREEPFELVTNSHQATQLALYRLFDAREQGPISIPIKPRLRGYTGGDRLSLTPALAVELGLVTSEVVVLSRAFDPLKMTGTLTVVTETEGKHAAALGATGEAPAVVPLPTAAQLDAAARTQIELVTGEAAAAQAAADAAQVAAAAAALTAAWPNVTDPNGTRPANNATVNRWYVAASDPGGVSGDGWKDTSTTPAKLRLKVGGSWVDVSSLVTDTAQISDGAQLGLTALWTGVTGASKPENYATTSDNTIVNAGLAGGTAPWSLFGSIVRYGGSAGDPAPGYFFFPAGVESYAWANGAASTRLDGAKKLFVSGKIFANGPLAGNAFAIVYWRRADGSAASTAQTNVSVVPATNGSWQDFALTVTPPADASHYFFGAYGNGNANGFSMCAFRVASTQSAADVTAQAQVSIDGPPTIRVSASSAGAPLADTVVGYKRLLGSTDVTASTTWSIASSSGCTVAVSASGVVTRSGALSLGGKFTLRSVRDGLTKDLAVTFIRDDASPTSSTGSGGNPGTNGSGDVNSTTTSSSYGSAGAESAFTCVAGTAGQVALSISLNVSGTRSSGAPVSEYALAKLQWRAVAGTWTDVAAETQSSTQATFGERLEESADATISISTTKTGLTAGTTYEFRCLARRGGASSGVNAQFYGTLAGAGS